MAQNYVSYNVAQHHVLVDVFAQTRSHHLPPAPATPRRGFPLAAPPSSRDLRGACAIKGTRGGGAHSRLETAPETGTAASGRFAAEDNGSVEGSARFGRHRR